MNTKNQSRLGATFHRTFALRRNQIHDVLEVAYTAQQEQDGGQWDKKALRNNSSIGTRQAESAPRYAYGMGLIDENKNLTLFGKLVYENDPLLENISTLWLMHYYMSSSSGLGPSYWHDIVAHKFRVSDMFDKEVLSKRIIEHIKKTEDRTLEPRYARTCANIFLKTYTDDDGLSALGILQENTGTDNNYSVLEPEPPPLWAFAVALLDYCQNQHPGQMTINLTDLYQEGGLTSIFMLGEGRFNRYLHDLQKESLVEVYRVAPPYQLVLVNPDPTVAFAKLYTVDEYDEYDYY